MLSGYSNAVTVRQEVAPVTGSTTTVLPPTNFLYFTNSATTAAQTVVLPTSPVDGQMFALANTSIITALTFTPTVSGWANGTLAAGNGLLLSYSATLATPGWFVVNS